MSVPYIQQPEDIKEIIDKRYEAIKPLVKEYDRDEPITRDFLRRRSKELKEKGWNGFSPTSLWRHLQSYLENHDEADLAPKEKPKGAARKSQWPEHIQAAIDLIIRQDYMRWDVERPDILKDLPFLEPLDLNDRVPLRTVYNERIERLYWPFSEVPNFRVFKRRLNAITTEKERAIVKEGIRKAEEIYGRKKGPRAHVRGITKAELPNELWQADSHYTDLIIGDADGYRIGRLWLYGVVDRATTNIMGYSLSWEHPAYAVVQRALFNAMSPKDEILERVGIEIPEGGIGSHPWPMRGIPKAILADNGNEHNNINLQTACRANRIKLHYTKVRTPQWNATVERVFKTLNFTVHGLRGTTFSNTKVKGEYAPEGDIWATYRKFERLLVNEICQQNKKRKRRYVGLSPYERWTRGVEILPLRVPQNNKQWRGLRISLLPSVKPCLTKEGVQHNNRLYWNEKLLDYIKVDSNRRRSKVPFYIDPLDIERGFVFISEINDYIDVSMKRGNVENEIMEQIDTPLPVSEWEFSNSIKMLQKKYGLKVSAEMGMALARQRKLVLAKADSGKLTPKQRKQRERALVDDINREVDNKVLGLPTKKLGKSTSLPKRGKKKSGSKRKSKSNSFTTSHSNLADFWSDKKGERDEEVAF